MTQPASWLETRRPILCSWRYCGSWHGARRTQGRDLRPIDFRAHHREGRRGCNQTPFPALAIHRRRQLVAGSRNAIGLSGDLYGHRRLRSQIRPQHPCAPVSVGTTTGKLRSYVSILSSKKRTSHFKSRPKQMAKNTPKILRAAKRIIRRGDPVCAAMICEYQVFAACCLLRTESERSARRKYAGRVRPIGGSRLRARRNSRCRFPTNMYLTRQSPVHCDRRNKWLSILLGWSCNT